MVWFIHRPAKEKEKKNKADGFTMSDEERRQAFLLVAKNRNGPTMDIELEFHEKITTFKDHLYTSAPYPGDAGFGAFP